MYQHQQQVKEFHEKMQLLINDKPTIPSEEVLKLRCKLLLEEVLEFCTAAGYIPAFEFGKPLLYKSIELQPDLIEMADALADIQYVNDGAAVSLGIDLESISNEVHRSNMSKLWNDKDVLALDHRVFTTTKVNDNQWLVKDSHGKVIKAPSYSPADIRSELIRQGASL